VEQSGTRGEEKSRIFRRRTKLLGKEIHNYRRNGKSLILGKESKYFNRTILKKTNKHESINY
jgi:hypothetical protein